MKNFYVLIFMLLGGTLFGQNRVIDKIELKGYDESIRTVHFSSDETAVYGDWDHLVKWSLSDYRMDIVSEIPGYNTNKSGFNGKDLWVNGNSNYNTEKKDILDMHNNMNVWKNGEMSSRKKNSGMGVCALVPNSTKAIVAGTNAKYQYSVKIIDALTGEKSQGLFNEGKDGAAVPTAIKVSADGGLGVISFAGGGRGIRAYDLSNGKLIGNVSAEKDVNDIAYSDDNECIYYNDGSSLIGVKTSDWSATGKWDFEKTITTLDADSSGRFVVVALQDKGVILLDSKTEEQFELYQGRVFDVTFSPNGNYIAIGIQKTLKSKESSSVLLIRLVNFY